MTMQYFLFDTYLGDIIRTVPLVLLTMVIWYLIRYGFKNRDHVPAKLRLWQTLFAGYIAGIIGLAWLYRLISDLWVGVLFNHFCFVFRVPTPQFTYHLEITFWGRFRMENLGNLLMYVPFGILFPLALPNATWKKGILIGFLMIIFIETGQMFFGRAPDLNDVVLNAAGLFFSILIVYAIRRKQGHKGRSLCVDKSN